jgi:hypothetical protein
MAISLIKELNRFYRIKWGPGGSEKCQKCQVLLERSLKEEFDLFGWCSGFKHFDIDDPWSLKWSLRVVRGSYFWVILPNRLYYFFPI